MDLKFNEVESIQELYNFNCDAIVGLTAFVVGGCEAGNVYNVFFETGKGRYCYQTLDVSDYVSAQDFVYEWSNKRIKLIISAINNHSEIIVGAYSMSQEGVSINGELFHWEDSFLIFDGIQTILKSNSTGNTHSIDNTQDFFGYLVVCLFHPSPTREVQEARAKWMGRDLIAELDEKNRIESVLHLQALERDYLESIFQEMLVNAVNNFASMDPYDLDLTHGNQNSRQKIWEWGELSDDEFEEEEHDDTSEDPCSSDWGLEGGSFDESLLDDFDIDYIYHITHYSNLQNILNNGLLAHDNKFVVNNIDNASVNRIRTQKEPVFNKTIHSYVPFYFNPKNPMLYVNKSRQHDILILAFNRKLLTKKRVLFTDGNAAKNQTKFYSNLRDLDKLNWDCLHAKFWTDFENGKSHRMAEVLVWKKVSSKALKKIFCFDHETLRYVLSKDIELDVELNKDFYF